MQQARLSKSIFVRGQRCEKRFWLWQHHQDLAAPPSEFQGEILKQGQEVGALARQLFPGGILIEGSGAQALVATQAAILKRQPLFEAAFEFQNIIVRADILLPLEDGTFRLIEVKSSTDLVSSRGLKKDVGYDVAIQKYVIEKSGLRLGETCVGFLNKKYRRQGELNLHALFRIEKVDDLIAKDLAQVPDQIAELVRVQELAEAPKKEIASYCKTPQPCEFKAHCWAEVGDDSIHKLYRIRDPLRFALRDQKISSISAIPADTELNPSQRAQWHSEREGGEFLDRPALTNFLNEIQYPLYFLDFEAYGFALPPLEGMSPYESLCFQYSLHVQEEPNAQIKHVEFLFDSAEDPRPELAQSLCEQIGPEGSVVVYSRAFEGGRLKEMAELCPDLAPSLLGMRGRLFDLLEVFQQGLYWHKDFKASASIKNVLPVLVPGLSYKDLAIQKGDVAQNEYRRMISPQTLDADRKQIHENLLRYCERDTWAMVKILEALQAKI